MRRLFLASAVLLAASPALAADLGIVVTNVSPETGELRIVVRPEGDAEPRQQPAADRGGGQAGARFTDLAPGPYEVIVQDLGARSIGRGRVTLAEPATDIAVALAPVSKEDEPIHPNAVEWHRRLQ